MTRLTGLRARLTLVLGAAAIDSAQRPADG